MLLPDGPYRELVQALTDRRNALGIPQLILDERIGWPNGYTGKVEIGLRQVRLSTACEWAQALGLSFVLRPVPKGIGHNSRTQTQLSFLNVLAIAPPHRTHLRKNRQPGDPTYGRRRRRTSVR